MKKALFGANIVVQASEPIAEIIGMRPFAHLGTWRMNANGRRKYTWREAQLLERRYIVLGMGRQAPSY